MTSGARAKFTLYPALKPAQAVTAATSAPQSPDVNRDFEADIKTDPQQTLVKPNLAQFHETPVQPTERAPAKLDEPREYDLGFLAGQSQANDLYQSTLAVMQKTVTQMESELQAFRQQIEQQHLKMLITCMEQVFPALMQGGSGLEICTVINATQALKTTGQIEITTHPDNQDAVRALCGTGTFSMLTDDTLSANDVRIRWQDGGADIQCETIAKDCHSIAQSAFTALTGQSMGSLSDALPHKTPNIKSENVTDAPDNTLTHTLTELSFDPSSAT